MTGSNRPLRVNNTVWAWPSSETTVRIDRSIPAGGGKATGGFRWSRSIPEEVWDHVNRGGRSRIRECDVTFDYSNWK